MDLHARQQFDFLLATAIERFSERLIQRNEGAENALRRLRENPQGEGIWLDEFVAAIFQDFLLNNTAGACFILESLEKQSITTDSSSGKVQDLLQHMAQRAFADLLARKLEESLEQAVLYSG